MVVMVVLGHWESLLNLIETLDVESDMVDETRVVTTVMCWESSRKRADSIGGR
jgi:hypothetical protein